MMAAASSDVNNVQASMVAPCVVPLAGPELELLHPAMVRAMAASRDAGIFAERTCMRSPGFAGKDNRFLPLWFARMQNGHGARGRVVVADVPGQAQGREDA